MKKIYSQPVRVGMVSQTDLNDPNPISGMPYRMAQTLRDQGFEVIPIPAWEKKSPNGSMFHGMSRIYRRQLKRRTCRYIKNIFDILLPSLSRFITIRDAKSCSAIAQNNLNRLVREGVQIDCIFGYCVSKAFYQLSTNIPLFYCSDATSLMLEQAYPVFAQRGNIFRKTFFEIEKTTLNRVSIAIFPANISRDSATISYNIPFSRTRIVEMGALIYPQKKDKIESPAPHPTRDLCNLLIVAADPVRKRVDFATHTTEILRNRGINAKLHVIGRGTKRSRHSPAVNSIGFLKLSNSNDQVKHQSVLKECHFQLLPSLGEAFGLSPCDSAQFARPSIVSSVGGLPWVIHHNKSGVVIDVDAQASTWADTIESLIDDPIKYQNMSIAALERAQRTLNWDVWGKKIRSIILEQLTDADAQQTVYEIKPENIINPNKQANKAILN